MSQLNLNFFKINNNLTLEKILVFLKISVDDFFKFNNKNVNILKRTVSNFSSFKNTSQDSIFFLNQKLKDEILNGFCLTSEKFFNNLSNELVKIPSHQPKSDFIKLVNEFCSKKIVLSGNKKIDTSSIAKNVNIEKTSKIGDFCKIDSNVKIGKNVYIGNRVTISDNCIIGNNCIIGDGSFIECSIIGNNVVICQNTVIGKEGFGFFRGLPNSNIFPHIGAVLIMDDAFIGSNCNIDRGFIEDTIIGKSVRIDNQVHIAHNCLIGDNCIIAGKSALSGSVNLGNNVVLAGDVGIADNITIGKNCLISAGTKVFKNFPENSNIGGYPARNLLDWQKIQVLNNKMLLKKK